MKKFYEKYVWAFEFVGAAIILSIGLVMKFVPMTIFYIVGSIFVIMGVFRIVPLVKTTKDKLTKWLFIVEIIAEIAAGCYLFYLGTKDEETLGKVFGYLIGGVIYLRALVYFFSTVLRKEPTDFIMFFVHIVLISFGALIIGNGGFDLDALSWFILVLALFCVLFICLRGHKDYRNYRKNLVITEETKQIKLRIEQSDKEIETNLPSSDEIVNEGQIIEKEEIEEEIHG